ncbi:hypothetical protein [Pseudomonas sp. TMB3-21]
MSDVKHYHVCSTGLAEGASLGCITVVLVADHDRVTAERDALQQRLNAADQRMDDQYGLLLAWYESNAEGLVRVDDAAYHIVTATAEALDGKPTASVASELDPKIIGIVPMPPMEYDEP